MQGYLLPKGLNLSKPLRHHSKRITSVIKLNETYDILCIDISTQVNATSKVKKITYGELLYVVTRMKDVRYSYIWYYNFS